MLEKKMVNVVVGYENSTNRNLSQDHFAVFLKLFMALVSNKKYYRSTFKADVCNGILFSTLSLNDIIVNFDS